MDSQQLVSQHAPPLPRLSPPAEHDPSSSQQIHCSDDAGNADAPVMDPVRSEQRRTERQEDHRKYKISSQTNGGARKACADKCDRRHRPSIPAAHSAASAIVHPAAMVVQLAHNENAVSTDTKSTSVRSFC